MRGRCSAFLLSLALGSAGCAPWTVVPITEESGPFDAKSYVDSIWDERVNRATLESGRGVVREVNTESRSGRLVVALEDGAEVSILIGPVILGTALRDALGVEFSEFTNQLDYAAVANALNDRVVQEVVAGVQLEGLVGKSVSFTGARSGTGIVPVRLEVQ